MRWGVRDEASDDHSASELCMRELHLCQNLSVGPTFVVNIKLSTGINHHSLHIGSLLINWIIIFYNYRATFLRAHAAFAWRQTDISNVCFCFRLSSVIVTAADRYQRLYRTRKWTRYLIADWQTIPWMCSKRGITETQTQYPRIGNYRLKHTGYYSYFEQGVLLSNTYHFNLLKIIQLRIVS